VDKSTAEPASEANDILATSPDRPDHALNLASAENAGTTLREAIETVGRAGSSSSLLAINTVHRLVRTMAAWIQTLEARRGQLGGEVETRTQELQALESQIEQERRNADAVAAAARNWAADIEKQVIARKAELQAESDALDAQLRAIEGSLKDLPRSADSGVNGGPRPLEVRGVDDSSRPESDVTNTHQPVSRPLQGFLSSSSAAVSKEPEASND
jgi:hypothetical protein